MTHRCVRKRKSVSNMKNSRAVVVVIALVIAISAMAGHTANAATPTVNLKTAAAFSILAGTPAITNVGGTTVDKDVGIHPAAAVGLLPGQVGGTIHAADAVALQAKSDLKDAYIDAAGRPITANHGALGGLTLVSGVYNAGGVVLDLTGTVTLDGQNDPSSVWIFQATSSLVTASSSVVKLTNGASQCNIFWQVTSSATLGSGSTFVGTILALSDITLANGVTVKGRTLARNGQVTLINDTFTTTACAAAPAATATPTPAPAGGGGRVAGPSEPKELPSATLTPEATPVPAPVIPAGQIAAPTAAAIAMPAPTVAGVQVLPSTRTEAPMNALMLLGIALAGIGALLLLRRPVRRS